MAPTMNVDVYVAQERLRLKVFKEWWYERNHEDSKDFPLHMSAEDWDGQYQAYVQTELEQ